MPNFFNSCALRSNTIFIYLHKKIYFFIFLYDKLFCKCTPKQTKLHILTIFSLQYALIQNALNCIIWKHFLKEAYPQTFLTNTKLAPSNYRTFTMNNNHKMYFYVNDQVDRGLTSVTGAAVALGIGCLMCNALAFNEAERSKQNK